MVVWEVLQLTAEKILLILNKLCTNNLTIPDGFLLLLIPEPELNKIKAFILN